MTHADARAKRLCTFCGTLVAALLTLAACTREDVGGKGASDSASAAGGTSQAGGGAAGIDTAGTKVNTERSGSAVAPGPGRVPGTPGALTSDSTGGGGTSRGSGAKTKARRP